MIIITPIIYILIEAIKRTGAIPKKYLPIVAIIVGATLGYVSNRSLQGIVEGVTYGGLCVGIYEGQKNFRNKNE